MPATFPAKAAHGNRRFPCFLCDRLRGVGHASRRAPVAAASQRRAVACADGCARTHRPPRRHQPSGGAQGQQSDIEITYHEITKLKKELYQIIADHSGAPFEKVWDAYNNPKHIVRWAFASDDWKAPRAENDLRVGGKFMTRMEAKDGSFGFDFEGTYSEVKPQSKIVYAIADGRQVSIQFADLGGKTKTTIVFDAENQNPVEMQKGGWQAILDNFRKYTEAN